MTNIINKYLMRKKREKYTSNARSGSGGIDKDFPVVKRDSQVKIAQLLSLYLDVFERQYRLKLTDHEKFVFEKALVLGLFHGKSESVEGTE